MSNTNEIEVSFCGDCPMYVRYTDWWTQPHRCKAQDIERATLSTLSKKCPLKDGGIITIKLKQNGQ